MTLQSLVLSWVGTDTLAAHYTSCGKMTRLPLVAG